MRRLSTPLITQAARDDLLQRFVKEVGPSADPAPASRDSEVTVSVPLQVEGMPYALTLRKVLNTRSSHGPPGDYFCSELVRPTAHYSRLSRFPLT